ncbi:hypothetical protein M758_2G185300 [Ceratodon purpureus]|nr:hypothetical protein M758_2G185300 [Ceratodon purpureus]
MMMTNAKRMLGCQITQIHSICTEDTISLFNPTSNSRLNCPRPGPTWACNVLFAMKFHLRQKRKTKNSRLNDQVAGKDLKPHSIHHCTLNPTLLNSTATISQAPTNYAELKSFHP